MATKEDIEEKSAQERDLKQGEANLADEAHGGPLVIPRMLYEAGKMEAKKVGRSIKRHWEHR